MPIRNFYIDCKIDGRKSRLTGGPRAKDGGFELTIYQRSEGEKMVVLRVEGTVRDDEMLALNTYTHDQALPITYNRKRLLTTR